MHNLEKSISKLKEGYNWNDLKLFLAVARANGLSGAAGLTGVSAPTLGRRMNALEKRFGVALFERRQNGYRLTAKGQALFERTEGVELAVASIDRWHAGTDVARTVSIAAGTWTSAYLAKHVGALRGPNDEFKISFLASEAQVDIGRRAADIGIRNRRPEERWLARRKMATVAFAAYRSSGDRPDSSGWIGLSGARRQTPSARWLADRHAADIDVRADTPQCAMTLAKAGAGRVVLPCFVGDVEPDLQRCSDPITELQHDQWLVTHHEQRHERTIRRVMTRIADLIERDRLLFAGQRQ